MAEEAASRACKRCKDRRVKCDKRQPTCLRCDKLGKPCPGYEPKRKFVDEGILLRKKYQPTSDGSPKAALIDQGHEYGHEAASLPPGPPCSTPTDAIPPVRSEQCPRAFPRAPKRGMLDPATDALLLTEPPTHIPLTHTHPMLDEIWRATQTYDPEWFDLQPETYYSAAGNTCGFIPNILEIVDEVDHSDVLQLPSASATPISTSRMSASFSNPSNLWAPHSQLQTSALLTPERDHEMAYLIRHFTESVGPWMDLFDRDRHFTHLVPLKALRDALLKNAIAAVAAKQLGRVRGNKPFVSHQSQKPSAMEILDDTSEIDWYYKAANYYDKAIAFSRQYLQAVSGELNSPPSSNTQIPLSEAASDDLLVAISIFSLYESLDNLESSWLRHLVGLKSLLGLARSSKRAENQVVPSFTVARLASFWNFVRSDYQAAFMNRQKTLLDTEDVALWQSCGLQIRPDGSLYDSAERVKDDSTHSRVLVELVAHTLLWLLLRVMNYLASDQSSTTRQAQWDLLTRQLDHWYGNLPDTFQPCAQIRRPQIGRTSPSQLTECFYSIDACAAAMQLYHFARILLLIHRPLTAEKNMFRNRLKAYREVSAETIRHAHEIIGVALGRPHPAIRVEMLLPLSTAGACLEEHEERRAVLELLRAIEQDTGCATQSRCEELLSEWGWTVEPEGVT